MPTAILTVLHLTPAQVGSKINFLYLYCIHSTHILDPIVCPARSQGLVRYPATLAPAIGSKAVDTQCADNAHIRTGSISVVMCGSDGVWFGQNPPCECNAGYTQSSINGKQICQGITISFLQTIIFSLLLHSSSYLAQGTTPVDCPTVETPDKPTPYEGMWTSYIYMFICSSQHVSFCYTHTYRSITRSNTTVRMYTYLVEDSEGRVEADILRGGERNLQRDCEGGELLPS